MAPKYTGQVVSPGIVGKDAEGTANRAWQVDAALWRTVDDTDIEGRYISKDSIPLHQDLHIGGGADELDGDNLDIDWNPTNYTPDATPPEAANVDTLAAHLAGIDTALGVASGGTSTVSVYEGRHSTSSASYITVARVVINFDRLQTGTPEITWDQVTAPGAPGASVRLRNVTDGSNIFESTGIVTTGIKTETLTLSTGIKLCAFQHHDGGGTGTSRIQGVTLQIG